MGDDENPGRSRADSADHWTRIHTIFAAWLVVLSVLTLVVHDSTGNAPRPRGHDVSVAAPSDPEPSAVPSAVSSPVQQPQPVTLPGGRTTVFGGQILVAYYGTPGTGALGVLGERPPMQIWPRLRQAAAAYAAPGRRVQPVFEVIVSVARDFPGQDGDYSTDIPRSAVEPYIKAAHKLGALVVLDIQTGRSDFLTVARRWEWALRDPLVGLAIDPEWRMHGSEVPGRVIGHVGAAEVNRVSAWLSELTRRRRLPQKLFVIHQFRTSMLHDPQQIRRRPDLAMVQHVDGFGTPHEKLATFHSVARPRQCTAEGLHHSTQRASTAKRNALPCWFHEGFKLFYRADTAMMGPQDVMRIRPHVEFVSYQ